MKTTIEELIEAIEHDSIVTVKKLCKNGIDLTTPITIGLEYDLEDHDQVSILSYAIRNHASLDLIEVLLAYGCDIHEVDDDGRSSLDIAIKFKREDIILFCIDKGIDINETHRPSGITPIVLASCFNNTSIVELLLNHGAKINVQDSHGMSAKDYAKKLGQKKMLAFLDEKGAKFNRYPQETEVKSSLTAKVAESQKKMEGDMTNRQTPTEDMGFDSI